MKSHDKSAAAVRFLLNKSVAKQLELESRNLLNLQLNRGLASYLWLGKMSRFFDLKHYFRDFRRFKINNLRGADSKNI